jgi:hypothetical protein
MQSEVYLRETVRACRDVQDRASAYRARLQLADLKPHALPSLSEAFLDGDVEEGVADVRWHALKHRILQ